MDAAIWLHRGRQLFDGRHYRSAMACFSCALELQPAWADAQSWRGLASLCVGRTNEGLEDLQAAAAAAPGTTSCFNLALALVGAKRYDDAARFLADALLDLHQSGGAGIRPAPKQDTDLLESLLSLVRCRTATGHGSLGSAAARAIAESVRAVGDDRLDDAMDLCDRLLSAEPRQAVVWNNKAHIHLVRGQHELAYVCLAFALDLDPTQPHAWCTLGELLVERGAPRDALTCFENSVAYHSTGKLDDLIYLRTRAEALLDRAAP